MKHFGVVLFIGLFISLWSCQDESPKEKKYEVNNCFVQKGPFVQGSNISVIELTDNFEPSGSVFNTETKDDLGSFSISALLNSKFVEVNANGYYFNEVSGKIDGPISLKVFTDLSSVNNLNVNILTLLAKDRIKQLMLKDHKEYAEAKKQAEGEILHIFNIPDEITNELVSFEKMNINENNQSAAVLLAISLTIQGNLSAGELSELLAKISSDIADNGVIDSKDLKTKLNINGRSLNPIDIRNNIIRRYSDLNLSITVAPFEKYIDVNGNGIIDFYDFKLTTPSGIIYNVKPEFTWSKSEKPTVKYQFQISSDADFSSIIEEMGPIGITSYQLNTTLEYNKSYYWRVAMIDDNTGNKDWSSVFQLTPKTGIIDLNTDTVTGIVAYSVSCGGTIINDGGASITERGIVFSTTSNPTINNNKLTIGNGTGNFRDVINGLTENTTYYFRAFAINSEGIAYGNEVKSITGGVTGTFTDIDGNVYHEIRIGTQVWMGENLKTTKYNDGTPIPNLTDITIHWADPITGYYNWYKNDAATYKNPYGALYDWYAVNTGKLAPVGWHVPTATEWTTLANYLGGESIAGGKLKEKGTTHWNTPNTGATNETDFTALPGGFFYGQGFEYIGGQGYYWSSSSKGDSCYLRTVDIHTGTLARLHRQWKETLGFSVRCVKD